MGQEVIAMKESPLMIKSKAFALDVIKVCKELRVAKCESALINQFLRSGTSIGANIREAFYAHGKADFVAKLQIALKECSESEYWIELLLESGYYNDTVKARVVQLLKWNLRHLPLALLYSPFRPVKTKAACKR